jgi:hypothetical protein
VVIKISLFFIKSTCDIEREVVRDFIANARILVCSASSSFNSGHFNSLIASQDQAVF